MPRAALKMETVWLRLRNYAIVPLKIRLTDRMIELTHVLKKGVRALPDARRTNFYDVELENGWAYIHVRDDARTVYVVAITES